MFNFSPLVVTVIAKSTANTGNLYFVFSVFCQLFFEKGKTPVPVSETLPNISKLFPDKQFRQN